MPSEPRHHRPVFPPPRWLSSLKIQIVLFLLILIPFFIPLSDTLRFHVLWGPLGNRVHVILFGLLTLGLYWYGPVRGRLGAAFLVSLLVGCLVEIMQVAFGRSPSWNDLGFDALGSGLVAGVVFWKTGKRGIGTTIVLGILILMLFQVRDWPTQYRAAKRAESMLPVLSDFEPPLGCQFWSVFFGSQSECRDVEDGPHGQTHVLAIDIPASDRWPGVSTQQIPLDWSVYNTLAIDVRVSGVREQEDIPVGIRLEDVAFLRDGEYYSEMFMVDGNWSTIQVQVHGLQTKNGRRTLDPSRMITLKFYAIKPRMGLVIELDNVRFQ